MDSLLIDPENILVRVPNWLGDTIMATPVVSTVRKMFPKSGLTILCKDVFVPFWRSFPGVNHVLTLGKEDHGVFGFLKKSVEIENKKFDLALILPVSFSSAFLAFTAGIPVRMGWGGEGRELFLTHVIDRFRPRQKHLVLEYLELVRKAFGKKIPSRPLSLINPVSRGAGNEARHLFKINHVDASKGMIALAPGATYGPSKRWPLNNWIELVKHLLVDKKESLLILGGKEEAGYLEPLIQPIPKAQKQRVYSLVGRTTLLELLGVLKQCRLLVTNDTGPMHVAAAVGTPVVALFGSSSPTWTGPYGQGHEVIYKQVECSPCFQKTCPIGYKCLTGIPVDDVFKAIQKASNKFKKTKRSSKKRN